MWQDLVFTAGSVFSIVVLMPTLKDRMAAVPLGTSAPSAVIGLTYGLTFFTMGMVFSAIGSIATGVLWSLIAVLRSPTSPIAGLFDRADPASEPQGHAPAGD